MYFLLHTDFPEYSPLKFLITQVIVMKSITLILTEQNAIISPNFLVWKYCGKAQFPYSFGRIARNYAEAVPFRKNFHTRKLVEITAFYAVTYAYLVSEYDINFFHFH